MSGAAARTGKKKIKIRNKHIKKKKSRSHRKSIDNKNINDENKNQVYKKVTRILQEDYI